MLQAVHNEALISQSPKFLIVNRFILLAGHNEAIGGRLTNTSPFTNALFRVADRP